MRLLSFDPGGERLGWAVVEGPKASVRRRTSCVGSGVLRYPRGDEVYQAYRMRLTWCVRDDVRRLIVAYAPDRVVVEIVPPKGSEGFVRGTQGYLANVAATTVHNVAAECDIPVTQVSANSWRPKIAKRGRSKKITKAQIRNGVLVHLPELKETYREHLMEWDRWDAIAIGLHDFGCVT